ncbi:MAG: 4-oxalocrotonate tautomerase family protein [Syntrophorhabdaceae bacterium]|nr:4-oxalocrotonate tautomerase family protein [Syntrophorhabdaceae bacterium]
MPEPAWPRYPWETRCEDPGEKRKTGTRGWIDAKRRGTMPYVNIKVTKEGVTSEQKEKLIQGVTRLLSDVLGKKPQTTYVVIDEVETDNWGVGGETITTKRKREK